jgi:ADP-heptose:LPS heptosyltransferase
MTAHIGDFVWSTSAFAILKKTYPEVEITVIATKDVKEIAVGNTVIDDVIFCPYFYPGFKTKIRKLLWMFVSFPKIIFKRFDVCIILDVSRIATLLAKIARIPKIVGADIFYAGYNKSYSLSKFYTDKIKLPKNQDTIHTCIRFQTIIKSFFNIYNNALPVIPDILCDCDNTTKLKNLVKNQHGLSVALCIRGSKSSDSFWNKKNFKDIIDKVDRQFQSVCFYIIGTSQDFGYVQSIADKSNIKNLCGKTSLLELREVLKMMDLLISIDTGVIHVAATTKTHIISLHSSTSWKQTGPLTHRSSKFHKELDCWPCIFKRTFEDFKCTSFPEPKCMQSITVDEVYREIAKILKKVEPHKLHFT